MTKHIVNTPWPSSLSYQLFLFFSCLSSWSSWVLNRCCCHYCPKQNRFHRCWNCRPLQLGTICSHMSHCFRLPFPCSGSDIGWVLQHQEPQDEGVLQTPSVPDLKASCWLWQLLPPPQIFSLSRPCASIPALPFVSFCPSMLPASIFLIFSNLHPLQSMIRKAQTSSPFLGWWLMQRVGRGSCGN